MQQPFHIVDKAKTHATPLIALTRKEFGLWEKKQSVQVRDWLKTNRFSPDAGSYCRLSDERVVCGLGDKAGLWSLAAVPAQLGGTYKLEGKFNKQEATQLALGWALGCYQFSKYKKSSKEFATLVAPVGCDLEYVRSMAESIYWARDLINTPAGDMHPAALAAEAVNWAKSVKNAKPHIRVLKGQELLRENYPMIYTVGKAAEVPPHFVDIRFERRGAPKVTLVGKGVTFDSGGLDLKSSGNMKLMKKDMGGAAAVLALARTLVATNVPIQLRVLLPIVENAVAGNAMRPLDIAKTRKGLTVEIGNTDAEGRLILCDALFEGDSEKPDLLIDCATLTGAARVALGTEIPAFFTNDDKLAAKLAKYSERESDPLWRLPLWKSYRPMLNTAAADLSNDPDSAYGGAITAALYLNEFVSKTPSWLHIDMMAWNLSNRPGRPQGGEAMAIRALYALIKEQYGH